MVFKVKIPCEKRALAIYLRKETGASYPKIGQKCGISTSSAERICKEFFGADKRRLATNKKRGRPKKISERMKRLLQRNLLKMREEDPNFTVEKLLKVGGFDLRTISVRTYMRCLNKMGFQYLQTRKKGLLTARDRQLRLQYTRRMNREERNNPGFWKEEIGFFLDGVSFVFKTNPFNTAMSPKSRVWRKKSEGLQLTSKGSKELAGRKRLHVMVAIAYGKGVVLKEPYEKLNGTFFANFIREHFNLCFGRAGPKRNGARKFVMDNYPSLTSQAALTALEDTECELFVIPPRSPDLNPIENIFHVVKDDLEEEAIVKNIIKESFEEFKARVLKKLGEVDSAVVDRAIESMATRITLIIKGKGYRTKY